MPIESLNVRSIFDRAVEITSAADRQAYVDEACVAAPEIREQVEALLVAHANAGSFLNAADIDQQRTSAFDRILERPGTVIGPYKLLLLTAVQNSGAGVESRRSNLAAHRCASLRSGEDRGDSPYFPQLRREAEECAATCKSGPMSVGRF